MSLRTRPALYVLFAGALLATLCVGGENANADDVAVYLAERDLIQVLAVHLEQQLAEVDGEQRDELLRALADLYAELLETTANDDLRETLEKRGRAILAEAPPEGADGLRLALLRGPYRLAERIAEQHRLRLADEEKLEHARKSLNETIPELLLMVQRADATAELARRRLSRAGSREATEWSAHAERAEQQSNQTRFLAAWALYYQAYLSNQPRSATQAEELFGELLDPQVSNIRPEAVSVDLRAVESFARSILGMALCRSLTSTSVEAMRWLALLEHNMTVASLRDQVPVWSMVIHLEHDEFRQARAVMLDATGSEETPPTLWLRLLAVHSAEDENYDVAAVENVRLAVTGLAASGELEHVLDLARKYGDDLLGSSGFAMHYVNGLLLYQRARETHGTENPPANDEASALYAEAADAFELAINEGDAKEYESAAAGSLRLIGLCRYYRGDFLSARDAFVQASQRLPMEQAAEALWMAISSLDQVVRAGDNAQLRSQLHELIDEFLNRFPSNRHAPTLVVRRAATSRDADLSIVDELLAIPSGSASYAEARRRAADMLYRLFRTQRGDDRAATGNRFLNVVVPQINDAFPANSAHNDELSSLLVLIRQTLEVALTRGVERLAAANEAFDAIESVRTINLVAIDKHKSEFAFRRLQFAILHDVLPNAVLQADELWTIDPMGQWALLASRAMFQHINNLVETNTLNRVDQMHELQLLVRFGGRVLREYEDDDDALNDRTILSYHAIVAAAAMRLWEHNNDDTMGRRALFLYEEKLLEKRSNNAGFLRAAGLLGEHFQRTELALNSWRRLVAGLPVQSEEWFEAKFHVLSILEHTDVDVARAVMKQHKLLNPNYGPDPWGARLRAIDKRISEDALVEGATG